jgi:response regulator RpfG family c-di-GMP phosphodiesterase
MSGYHRAPSTAQRILVVDDEQPIRHLLSVILRNKCYEVAEAADGLEALDTLSDQAFDLVLTDMRMPRMDGLTLLQRIQAGYPDTPVIVLTGYGTIQSAVQAIKQGAADFLTKPFDMAEVEQKIEGHLLTAARTQPAHAADAGAGPDFEPLVELGRILSGQTDLSDMIDQTIALLKRTFAPLGIRVTLFDEELEGGLLTVNTGRYVSEGLFPPLAVDATKALVVAAHQLGEAETRTSGKPQAWLQREAVVAETRLICLTVPLEGGGVPDDDASVRDLPMTVLGALTMVRDHPFPRADAQLLRIFGLQLGLAMLHGRTRQRLLDAFQNLQQLSLSTVETLFEALRTYDTYTHDHSERVSRFARMLGERAGIVGQELEILAIAALLHDVGKLGIGDTTLHKEDDLTGDEQSRIRLHPGMGARILGGMEAFVDVVPLVRAHHERYDGTGYPDGLAGEDIPMGARILAVVDAFDSITSHRPYRQALSVDEALKRLQEAAGTQFDDALVEMWVEIVSSSTFDPNLLAPECFPV